jgi:hypothetical protein
MSETKDYKQFVVFDANFFICMKSIRARNILDHLDKVAQDLNLNYYISEVVYGEIKASPSFKKKFKDVVNVQKVSDDQIKEIKKDLKNLHIRFPAQDNDLSLIALGKDLINKNMDSIYLVTDDFKLAKNTTLLYPGNEINILSLSSFLLKIQRTVTKPHMRNYFKNVWKQSLNYTLGYMIERSKIYPAEEKITWLIERAVSVTENSVITSDSANQDLAFGTGKQIYSEELEAAESYIEGKNLPPSKQDLIQDIVNFLENLKISREYIVRSRKAIVKQDTKSAVKYLKKGNGFLVSLLQLALGQLKKIKNYEIVEQLICSEISKMEFLRAFLLTSLGRINSAIDSLERAALFSTIIHNYQTCLTLNYIKALILLFHALYDNSIMAYNFTEELADVYGDERLKLKCSIGKAIALYLKGNQEEKQTAIDIMSEISQMNFEENIIDAVIVFSELGDYFLALGHSQLATNLYDEALEMAIDANIDWKVDILIEKLKRSYIATVLNGYSAEEINERLDVLLDKAYRVKDIEKYNEQIRKISSFNQLFYTPFPHITGKKKILSYKDMPKELKDKYLEVVYILKEEGKKVVLFIVSHYQLGLLGIKLYTEQTITGIAENYSLKIKPTAKVKIYKPDDSLKESFLIRAIIEIVEKEGCDIEYSLPSFFKQLNL